MPINPNTVTEALSLVEYDCETGEFKRKSDGRTQWLKHPKGYLMMFHQGATLLLHRLAWAAFYGEWPTLQVDHIDGDKQNNRISNLRLVTNAENQQNLKRATARNRTGLLGVAPSGNGFRAHITVDGRQRHLGSFPSASEAHGAYLTAKRELHTACTI